MDTTAPSIVWQPVDDLPTPVGITHAAQVIIGTKFYMCGGYVGGVPGPDTNLCFVYDNSVTPGNGNQWSSFPPLPEGRAGGGMVYDTKRNALYFASGGRRLTPGGYSATDYNTTWMFSFNNPSAGWITKIPIPYAANHLSSVTAIDNTGKE